MQFAMSAMRIASLAVMLTAAAATAQQQPVLEANLATRGNPTTALATTDGHYLFVSVTNVDAPNFTGSDAAAGARTDAISGIEVFRRRGFWPGRRKFVAAGIVRTGSTGANGMVLLRGERTLAVGVGDAGVAFLDVRQLIHLRGTPVLSAQGKSAGTFDVVASPNGSYVFSSNEYGVVDGQRGSVGVLHTYIDKDGRVEHPDAGKLIALGDVLPSLSISPDGSRIYAAVELVPTEGHPSIAGSQNKVLTRNDCVQAVHARPRPNGYVAVLDVARLTNGSADPVIARVAAACSPVRLVESADASSLYVSARGNHMILRYDPRLLESDPEHALLDAYPSGGTAPVGVQLFRKDHLLAVANSNRFTAGAGNLALFDLAARNDDKHPLILSAGNFPRNISRSKDEQRLFLTNYTSRTVQIYRMSY